MKYWLFKKRIIIYSKDRSWFKFEFKRMDEYWILFFGKFIFSNNIIKLNKDWKNI
jgi:hypothetical protein